MVERKKKDKNTKSTELLMHVQCTYNNNFFINYKAIIY
jgi:hypothetical protein